MPATTVNLRALPIPTPQQRQRCLPISRLAFPIERRRLPDTKRVADLVHRRPLRHVGAVAAEPEVSVVVGFGSRDAGGVVDADGLLGVGVARVAGDGGAHGIFDLAVGVLLVGGGIGGFLQGPVYGGGGGREAGCCEGDDGEPHCGVGRGVLRVLVSLTVVGMGGNRSSNNSGDSL